MRLAATSPSAPSSRNAQLGVVHSKKSSTTWSPGGTITPTSPGEAMKVSASSPSTLARQPGSKATFRITAPCRCIDTRPVNVPSSMTDACAPITPGALLVCPMTAVTGGASLPPYSTDGSGAPGRRSRVGRLRRR